MKRALGTFRYCASFETQDRGAMHVHIATHKLPQHAKHNGVVVKAWQLGTRIWRDVVKELGGLCFVGGKQSSAPPQATNDLGKNGGLHLQIHLEGF